MTCFYSPQGRLSQYGRERLLVVQDVTQKSRTADTTYRICAFPLLPLSCRFLEATQVLPNICHDLSYYSKLVCICHIVSEYKNNLFLS